MAYRWETSDSVWLEDERNGQFELASSRGLSRIEWQAQARSRLPDVAQLLGASLPGTCSHAAIYPEGFAYCPECGATLQAGRPGSAAAASGAASALAAGDGPGGVAASGSGLPAWWGASSAPLPASAAPLPKFVPQGLALTALPLAAALEIREAEPAVGTPDLKIPVPPNAVCMFAAADFGFAAQRLLALAYTRNVLQYWDPMARRWHLMAPEAQAADLAFTASAYAWLPPRTGAVRGDAGIVPTAYGLARLLINPVSESYRTDMLLSAPLSSAPGMVSGRLACLIAAAGGVRLWTADADGADGETLDVETVAQLHRAVPGPDGADGDGIPDPGMELAEEGAVYGAAEGSAHRAGHTAAGSPSSPPLPPASDWSRPFSYDGKLIWLHDQGEIWWRPGTPPQWLPWPAGWTPRLQFGGPVRSRDGRLWQIGHDGKFYTYRELGAPRAQEQVLDGARLGMCTFLFRRGHQVKDEPWAGANVEDQGDDHGLVLPLLENVSSTRAQPTGLVLRLETWSGMAEAALEEAMLPRVLIEWVGQRNVILDEVSRLRRPIDCQPFVYDNCLWLHHPSWNDMRGWRLEAHA